MKTVLTKKAPQTKTAGPAGAGVSASQLVRASNRWRDAYNPMRGLVIAKVVQLLEAGERGAFAELMVTMRKVEKRYPTLKALKTNRLAAITRLDYDIKIPDDLKGPQLALAEKQQEFLKQRYALIRNLKEALRFLALAEFRGFSILQKHRFTDGPNDGAVMELHWLPQWNWTRDGWFGDFFYNEKGTFGAMPQSLGAKWRINDPASAGNEDTLPANAAAGLDRADFIIRECDSPLYEIALLAFVNWMLGRKDWAGFVEIFGIARPVVTMPPNIPKGDEAKYLAAAQAIAEGVSGALPHGGTATFPSAGVRNNGPFKEFCEAQDEDVILAGTGGKLTMLAESGSGTLAGGAHQQTFDRIAEAEGDEISEVMQRDFDRAEIEAAFPGEPILAYFKLATKAGVDIAALSENVVRLESTGLQTDVDEISEKTGLKLTRIEKPAVLPSVGGDASGRPVATLPEAGGPIKNRELPQKNAEDTKFQTAAAVSFAGAIKVDFEHLLARLGAIQSIQDPELFRTKMAALMADFAGIEGDILADPESARALADILGTSLAQGMANKTVTTN